LREVDGLKFDDVYDGMAHTVRKGFSTSKVFGEPIKVNERVTIIPVAKVMMGGGGGGGEESVEDEEKKDGPEIGKKSGGGGCRPCACACSSSSTR
jgi:uncharacterized spore protein YtfJ